MYKPRVEIVVLVVLLAIFAVGLGLSYTYLERAQPYPRVISALGIVLTVLEITLFSVRTYRSHRVSLPSKKVELVRFAAEIRSILPYVIWILFYFLLIWLIGLVVGSGIFTFMFLWRVGDMRWHQAILGGIAIMIVSFLIYDLLSLALPDALYDPFQEFRSILRLPF